MTTHPPRRYGNPVLQIACAPLTCVFTYSLLTTLGFTPLWALRATWAWTSGWVIGGLFERSHSPLTDRDQPTLGDDGLGFLTAQMLPVSLFGFAFLVEKGLNLSARSATQLTCCVTLVIVCRWLPRRFLATRQH